jgi:hypothetical protein
MNLLLSLVMIFSLAVVLSPVVVLSLVMIIIFLSLRSVEVIAVGGVIGGVITTNHGSNRGSNCNVAARLLGGSSSDTVEERKSYSW